MTAASWEVVAIGLPGHRSCDPVWTTLAIDVQPTVVTELATPDKKIAAPPRDR